MREVDELAADLRHCALQLSAMAKGLDAAATCLFGLDPDTSTRVAAHIAELRELRDRFAGSLRSALTRQEQLVMAALRRCQPQPASGTAGQDVGGEATVLSLRDTLADLAVTIELAGWPF